MTRFVSRSLITIIAISLVALCSAPAAGQGTSGQLPDPISSRDIDRYAMRLDLSEQQKQAVLDMHASYLGAFRALREGPIEEFLKTSSNAGMFRVFSDPDEAELKKSVRDLESVLDRIATTDKRFFDSIQSILTEDQTVLLQQVRNARERARYQATVMRLTFGTFNPAFGADIARMFDDLELTAQQRARAMPIVQQYESSMTVASRDFFNQAMRMPLKTLQLTRDEGIDFTRVGATPEERSVMMERIGAIFMNVQRAVAKEMGALSDLNRRTLTQLTNILPHDAGRALHRAYLQRAYFEIPSNEGAARKHIERAMELELDAETQTAVADLRAGYFAQIDTVRRQLMDDIDTQRAEPRNFMAFNKEAEAARQEKQQAKIESGREQITRINDNTIQSLASVIGEEPAQRIGRKVAEAGEDQDHSMHTMSVVMFASPDGGGGGGAATLVSVGGFDMATAIDGADFTADLSDPYLPGPISTQELGEYADLLELDETDRAIAETLHEDYADRYDELRSTRLKDVREAEQNQWKPDLETNTMIPPSPADISRLFSMRRAALSAILATDAALFEDIQTALLDDDDLVRLERAQLARQRTIYNRGAVASSSDMLMMQGPGSRPARISFSSGAASDEQSIDVAALIAAIDLDANLRSSVDSDVLSYERVVTEAFRQRYTAGLKAQEARDRVMVEQMTASADGSSTAIRLSGSSFGSANNGDGPTTSDLNKTIITLNRQLLDTITAQVPEDAGRALRLAYDRKAYPDIYDDSSSAEDALARALAIPTLNDTQREQLNTLALEYRAGYADVCRRMVEARRAAPQGNSFAGGPDFDWQAMQESQRINEKLRFERNEGSNKAIAKIRAILTDDQASTIPRLASPH